MLLFMLQYIVTASNKQENKILHVSCFWFSTNEIAFWEFDQIIHKTKFSVTLPILFLDINENDDKDPRNYFAKVVG